MDTIGSADNIAYKPLFLPHLHSMHLLAILIEEHLCKLNHSIHCITFFFCYHRWNVQLLMKGVIHFFPGIQKYLFNDVVEIAVTKKNKKKNKQFRVGSY